MSYYLLTVFKLLLGFVVMAAYLKLGNKLQTTQLTPIDFMGNFVLGGIVGGVIYNDNIPLLQYLLLLVSTVALIMLLNRLITKLMPVRRLVMGAALPVIVDGKLQLDSLSGKDTKFDLIDFMAQLRSRGIFSLREIDFAQIEVNGGLTVIKRGEGTRNFLLLKSGQVLDEQLRLAGRDEAWLHAALAQMGIGSTDDVFLAELSNGNELYVVRTDASSEVKIFS